MSQQRTLRTASATQRTATVSHSDTHSLPYPVRWYPFTEHPRSDSCWSVTTGPDGKIYAAACAETVPAETAVVFRYDDHNDRLQKLLEVDRVVNDPRDSGRAPHCKIHYSFAPSPADGMLYMATHLSGPPAGQTHYSPWLSWHDPSRCFRASALIAYDTRRDQVAWWDTLIPKEGCRCLLHDPGRNLLYALSYPRDHLFVYDIKRKNLRDCGRIGSVNSQVLFTDSKHRVWTAGDDGHLVRYDPDTQRLEWSPYRIPHDGLVQNGWHSVLYDAVRCPHDQSLYMLPWSGYPRLLRFWPDEGPWGRINDLGPTNQPYDRTLPVNTFLDHCGGLTFARDRCLYYVAARWQEPVHQNLNQSVGVLYRYDPAANERHEVATLKRPDALASQYVSRAAIDRNGNLFFGHVNEDPGARPSGIFKVTVPPLTQTNQPALRMWG